MDTVPRKRVSKLDVKIQSLLELICDLKAMEECVLEMKFDVRKAPLGECGRIRTLRLPVLVASATTGDVFFVPEGKLTSEQIRAGYTALQRIEACLKKKGGGRELLEACNQFYTRIPHDFG